MGFFEPCSTMPAWHACLLAVGTSLASLTASTLYHQVSLIYELKQIFIQKTIVLSSHKSLWYTDAYCI
jgi:hypothetical protein